MGLLLSAYSLSVITHTNKQTNKQTIYPSSRSTHDTVSQYLQDSDHKDDNNINYKSYLHRGPCI